MIKEELGVMKPPGSAIYSQDDSHLAFLYISLWRNGVGG